MPFIKEHFAIHQKESFDRLLAGENEDLDRLTKLLADCIAGVGKKTKVTSMVRDEHNAVVDHLVQEFVPSYEPPAAELLGRMAALCEYHAILKKSGIRLALPD